MIKELLKKRIEIFIYQFPKGNEIKILNNLKNTKIINISKKMLNLIIKMKKE